VSQPQTFEMPSSDGRTRWTVTFESRSDDSSWDISFRVTARLVAGSRRHRAYFVVDRDDHALWPQAGLLSADEAERFACYERVAIRYCRRHLDEIVSQKEFEHRLRRADLDLVLTVDSGDVLQQFERDIDDLLDRLLSVMTPEIQSSRDLPMAEVWVKYEPDLRRLRDSDARIAATYETVAEFYEAYEAVRRTAKTELAGSVGRANNVGHYALRALYATRPPSRRIRRARPLAGTNGGWPADRAIHLRRIGVEDLRCFERVEVPLEPPEDPSKGQWLVLLGENGMGKTSILRALALALLPEDAARNHVYKLSERAGLIRKARDGRDIPAKLARIDVETGPGIATTLNIFQQRPRETLTIERPLPQRPLVLGYGCRRGSALGDTRRESNPDYLLGTETLFDEDARVIHADTWLRDIRDQNPGLFDSVCRILSELLIGVERISVEPGGITWVEGPIIGRVPLAGLSDGYLTTLGWLVDALARWMDYARAYEIPLGPDFHKRMPCVVLIDEIDLHLHPRWQTEVLTKLRNAFPMTTFVATTHNPLTLHGTEAGEVHVIRTGDDGRLEIVPKDLPPGIRTDELLTGEWFGLSSTLDADTQQLLKDHFALLQQGRPEGDPDRVQLEDKLRRRVGHFMATPAEVLARELVAEQLDSTIQPVTDEDRKRLRAMYEQRLRDAEPAIAAGRPSDDP
jgi:energy-coupling factor transporter ATP-binding protein EcfA2